MSAGEELLKQGYQAYGDYLDWAGDAGMRLQPWDELPASRKGAFAAFLRAALGHCEEEMVA